MICLYCEGVLVPRFLQLALVVVIVLLRCVAPYATRGAAKGERLMWLGCVGRPEDKRLNKGET